MRAAFFVANAHAKVIVAAKIDVEGHEAHVIAPLLASPLGGRIMALFYEQNRTWSSAAAIDAALARAGFAVTRRYGRARHHDVLALPRDGDGMAGRSKHADVTG